MDSRFFFILFLLCMFASGCYSARQSQVQTSGRMCSSKSKVYRGKCVSSNCDAVCKTEGIPYGECSRGYFYKSRLCKKDCGGSSAGMGGSFGGVPGGGAYGSGGGGMGGSFGGVPGGGGAYGSGGSGAGGMSNPVGGDYGAGGGATGGYGAGGGATGDYGSGGGM